MTNADRSPAAAFVSGPLLMLFLCLCGMAVGLAIDSGSVPLELLASLCLAGSDKFVSSVNVHLDLLPATHGMMLVGAVLAASMMQSMRRIDQSDKSSKALLARCVPDATCAAAMLVGMVVGGWLGPSVLAASGVGSSSAQLIGAMVLGMTAGMVLAMPLYRRRRVPAA